MKIRYIVGGAAALSVVSMATALGVVGVQNLDKQKAIQNKKVELNDKQGIYPQPESRVLKNPSSPAYPSPGYEN